MSCKILIIDDDIELLDELKELLLSNGYQSYAYSNGEAALDQIPGIKPDLILLDLKMDKVSGFQIADRLKNLPETEKIPVIAMTGHFPQEEYSLIMKICGIRRCLRKPFEMDEFLREIKSALEEKK